MSAQLDVPTRQALAWSQLCRPLATPLVSEGFDFPQHCNFIRSSTLHCSTKTRELLYSRLFLYSLQGSRHHDRLLSYSAASGNLHPTLLVQHASVTTSWPSLFVTLLLIVQLCVLLRYHVLKACMQMRTSRSSLTSASQLSSHCCKSGCTGPGRALQMIKRWSSEAGRSVA
jgi:hypothetical protein